MSERNPRPIVIDTRPVVLGTSTYYQADISYMQTNVTVTDMTPTAADAQKEVARYQFAVPAAWETVRWLIVGLCVAGGIGAIVHNPDAGGYVVGVIAVFGAIVTANKAIDRFAKKK